jgi:hypothetical protein
MASIETRLSRLEEQVPPGCDHCRDWRPGAFSVHFEDEKGQARRPVQHPRPETCPACGRIVPLGQVLVFRVRPDGPQ